MRIRVLLVKTSKRHSVELAYPGSILIMHVRKYVSVKLRNVAVTSRRNVANQRSNVITRNRSLSNIGRASETALFAVLP